MFLSSSVISSIFSLFSNTISAGKRSLSIFPITKFAPKVKKIELTAIMITTILRTSLLSPSITSAQSLASTYSELLGCIKN